MNNVGKNDDNGQIERVVLRQRYQTCNMMILTEFRQYRRE
jgi:hypothetical protein